MNRIEAEDAIITAMQAIIECRRHNIQAAEHNGALIDPASGERIAERQAEGYRGDDVLTWLGY